jgi:phage-related minor tail protein
MLVATAIATVLVEGYKFLTLQSELSKSIALTGASMGMSTEQAVALSESMAKAGGSTFAYMGIITEFAKAGAKANETTVKLAKDMEKYLGKAASATAQELAKIGDKPLSGLLETAKATGYVSKATLDNVHSLEQQGRTYEAIKVAQDAYVLANQKVIDQVKSEMNPAQELWFKIKEGVTAVGEAIYNLGTSNTVIQVAMTVWETFAVIVSEVWYVLKQTVQTVIDLFNVITAPVGTKLAVFDAAIENAKKAREEHDKSIESILKREAGTKKLTQAEINLRQANADAAKTAEERYKREEEALTLYKSSMANFQNIIAGASTEQKVLNKAQTDYIALLNNPAYKNFSQEMKDNANVEAKLASVMLEMQKGRDYRKEQNIILAEENANLELQTRLIGMTDAARIRANGTRKAEMQLLKDLEEIQKYQLEDDSEAKWAFKAAAYQRYSDRIRNVGTEIDNTFKAERMNAYGAAFENVFNGMGDAIVTFVQTGKFNMKSLIDSFIADIIRFEARAQSMAIYRGLNGAGGIMDFFTGNTAKAAAPDNIDVGGGWSPAQAKGGAWSDGMQMFAKGGSFTNSIVDSPTLFKFAKGTGMMGEAGPEAIMPLRRGADGSLGVQAQGGGSNVQVTVINNSNVEAKTTETTDSRGNRKIEVMIGDLTAAEVQRNGSSSQKALKSTFGLQPNLIRR